MKIKNIHLLKGRILGEILDQNQRQLSSGLWISKTLKKNAYPLTLKVVSIGGNFTNKKGITFKFNGKVGQTAYLKKSIGVNSRFEIEGKTHSIVWFEDVLACEN